MVNISFNQITLDNLKRIVGGTLESYSCDPFIFSHSAFGIVGLKVNGEFYKITAELEQIQRFFSEDEVAVFRFQKCQEEEIVSRMDNGVLQDYPVKDVITKISVVNDIETVSHGNDLRELVSTKGIVFHLSSGNEISFDVSTWFSEMISIRRGYDVISQIAPTDEFIEEWNDCEGYKASCTREVVSLSSDN